MLNLGFPIQVRRADDGATALNAAGYTGRVDVVRLLLAAGSDIEARDDAFDGTALSWATVGIGNPAENPDGDWVATVQALLDAGADTDGVWISGELPADAVAVVLFAHGIGPSDDVTDEYRPGS